MALGGASVPIPAKICYTPCQIFYVEHMGGNTKGDKQATGLHENGSQVSNASQSRCQVHTSVLPRSLAARERLSHPCNAAWRCMFQHARSIPARPWSNAGMRGWPGARSVTSAAMGWQCVIYTPATRRHAAAGLPLHAARCFGDWLSRLLQLPFCFI